MSGAHAASQAPERSSVVALPREALAEIAPNYEAMRQAIAVCTRVDEIANLADVAVAAQAYYRQSRDVENEMGSSRIRLRAERRLGEMLRRMKESGERASENGEVNPGSKVSHGATPSTLSDLGIPRDRASRAMQLAEVPEHEFEAALEQPVVAQPRRVLREYREKGNVTPKPAPSLVPIEHTLDLWGDVRDFGTLLETHQLPPLNLWRTNLQPFQIAHLRKYIPLIVTYLSAIFEEIERESA